MQSDLDHGLRYCETIQDQRVVQIAMVKMDDILPILCNYKLESIITTVVCTTVTGTVMNNPQKAVYRQNSRLRRAKAKGFKYFWSVIWCVFFVSR